MWINLHVHPLNFHDFSLISNIFINIHDYSNLIICIYAYWIKVLCLNIQLVPSLKVSDELLLRYEYFCRDIPILKKRIMRCHGNHAISYSSNRFILYGNIFPHLGLFFFCFTSHVNSYGRCGTVSSLNHTFSWADLRKRLTSNLCTYFRL